jgi:hypothetical protein
MHLISNGEIIPCEVSDDRFGDHEEGFAVWRGHVGRGADAWGGGAADDSSDSRISSVRHSCRSYCADDGDHLAERDYE